MAGSHTIARKISGKFTIRQLSLFPEVLCSAYLVAESPKCAFYRIWIESDAGVFTVRKESGIKDKVLDKRNWAFNEQNDARKLYDQRIRTKTNPERK